MSTKKARWTRNDFGMFRHDMAFENLHVRLFNGRGAVSPVEYSVTAFTNIQFANIAPSKYGFNFNFLDTNNKLLIQDRVPEFWHDWIYHGTGTDPLGANFRANFAFVPVTQDEWWEPNYYRRTATFYKKSAEYHHDFKQAVNFSITSETCVSHKVNAVYLKLTITNREKDDLHLKLLPIHNDRDAELNFVSSQSTIHHIVTQKDIVINLWAEGIKNESDGFLCKLAGLEEMECYFCIEFSSNKTTCPDSIEELFKEALLHSDERIQWMQARLPSFECDHADINALYHRAMLTMAECKWEREDFFCNPFWAVGHWLFTIAWDNSFSADIFAMLDKTDSFKTFIHPFTESELLQTYIPWCGIKEKQAAGIFYIQEPFAISHLLARYLLHTKNYSILTKDYKGRTLLEWLKYAAEMILKFAPAQGALVDIGLNTELVIEIRTDGYDSVVPIVNILAADFLLKLARYCEYAHDQSAKFWRDTSLQMQEHINKELWDPQERWFYNLYADGSRKHVWAYHLFDALNTEVLTGEQRLGLLSHLNEGEFLGPFGTYSIARKDTVHWDRIDADWGGGGQFAGMPSRIARACYEHGNSFTGFEILKRYAKYTQHFPYFSQNPRTDQPLQDLSSMPIQVSAGGGMEAIIFGVCGIQIKKDTIVIKPAYHHELGRAVLSNINIGDTLVDARIEFDRYQFTVYNKGKLYYTGYYGTSCLVER